MRKLVCLFINCFIIFTCLGSAVSGSNGTTTPKTIIIIRHADKLPDKYPNSGPALTPKGISCSMAFALFYINQLNTDAGGNYPFPDFIFPSNPYLGTLNYGASNGFRELLTVSPLVTYLYKARQEETSPQLVDIPFTTDQYKELVSYIYSKKHLQDKTILICWDHGRIPKIINELAKGFKVTSGQIPAKGSWASDDFSTVFILNYQGNKELEIIELPASTTYPVGDDIQGQMNINLNYYKLMASIQ